MHNTAQTTLISNGKNISSVWEFSPPHKGGESKAQGGGRPTARRHCLVHVANSIYSRLRLIGLHWDQAILTRLMCWPD